ncbi:MAG: hypothetical protein AB9903_19520 [Vulcanimicrobiota bacterium]
MAGKTRLNLSVSENELELIHSVVPPRKLSRFIMDAAVEKARQVKRESLRKAIVEAYEADPEFQKSAGAEWDAVSEEGWPEK